MIFEELRIGRWRVVVFCPRGVLGTGTIGRHDRIRAIFPRTPSEGAFPSGGSRNGKGLKIKGKLLVYEKFSEKYTKFFEVRGKPCKIAVASSACMRGVTSGLRLG